MPYGPHATHSFTTLTIRCDVLAAKVYSQWLAVNPRLRAKLDTYVLKKALGCPNRHFESSLLRSA